MSPKRSSSSSRLPTISRIEHSGSGPPTFPACAGRSPLAAVAPREIVAHWPIIANLLAGTLVGAWFAADLAMRWQSATLQRVIAVLLIAIAAVLLLGHDPGAHRQLLGGVRLLAVGMVAGLVIGIVASLLGVAGGELLIPTLVLLFGVDIKLAGSLSLAVSLPTMLVGFARYSRDRSFAVLRENRGFVLIMVAGSVAGAAIGGLWLGVVPADLLLPGLAAILVLSSIKTWRHA